MQRVGMLALGLFVAVVGATPRFASAADGGPSDAWLTTTAKIAILAVA
jgi:hypothetical protein